MHVEVESGAPAAAAVERARALADEYRRDGVVMVPGALDADALQAVVDVYEYGRAHPSPGAHCAYPETGATFYIDTFNAANWHAYGPAFADTVIPDVLQALWRSDDVWFFYEQLFLKEGGSMRRTPWHQDSSYLPVEGEHVAVVWIPLDPLEQQDSLEFAKGSHLGPLYNTSAFDPDDDTRPIVDDGDLPRLPDVEAHRDAWDIVSWAVEPGDLVIFHFNALHGGAPTRPGRRRRTVSLRYFGDDAVYAPRFPSASAEGEQAESTLASAFGSIAPGAPFRHPMFTQVRPRPVGSGA